MSANPETPVHDLLTRQDVDDLRQITRANNSTAAMAEVARARDHREAMAKAEETNALLSKAIGLLTVIATTLPALVDMQVPAKTNGHSKNDKETQDHG